METRLVFNGQLISEKQFNRAELQSYEMYYEVIRVMQGKLLFLTEHLQRFKSSLKLSHVNIDVDDDLLLKELRQCISGNHLTDANLRFSVFVHQKTVHRLVEVSSAVYPTALHYKNGVEVEAVKFMRENPNVKKWNSNIKAMHKRLCSAHKVYELLLLNENDCFTEGSQSNVFFIKDKQVFTAPDDVVLKGITRQYIIHAIETSGFSLKYQAVSIRDISKYHAAFISGTSPKVLPIRTILNHAVFDVNNPVLRQIMTAYDKILSEHLV